MHATVTTRGRLLASGLTVSEIDAQIRARRWRRLNDRVVALHNGLLTLDEARLAVWLSAQQPAALAGLTAAEVWGLRGHATTSVHIVVRRGARVLEVPGVASAVHESRRFDAADVVTTYEPARVSPSRAVVDGAVWSRRVHDASRLVAAAVQQRLVTAAELLRELQAAGQVRHRRVLTLLLQDLQGGAEALSEVELVRFCRRNGLPAPSRLNARNEATGRRRYLDAEFDLPNGRILRIEVDGGVHLSLAARWVDNRRDNGLWLSGIHPLRFPSVALYSDDPEAVAQIRTALRICQQHVAS